jgi:hypothetical protein
MKPMQGPATTLLRPILDMYMDSAVAITGCHSGRLARTICELDVVVVTNEKRQQTSLKLGDVFVDMLFVTEREAMKPSNPEHAMALAGAKPVKDTSLVLSTSAAANAAVLSEAAQKASRTRLSSSLKILGRAEAAASAGSIRDADFWLLASAYEFGYAWLFSKEVSPSPSHLLLQLRAASKGDPKYFEAFSAGAGLDAATRAGCGARLDGIGVVHDILRSRPRRDLSQPDWSPTKTEILSRKAKGLVEEVELAECYSFLGQELVDGILALTRGSEKKDLSSLTSGDDRLLGDRLLRQLGLARKEQTMRAALEKLRTQVTTLARKQ